MAGRIVVGTSSWADPGFVEEWYPRGLAARDRLAWYAERFEGVEVNATWYAIPAQKTVERWAEVTPDGFTFDVKLHKVLSRHSAQLDTLPRALRRQADVTEKGRVRLDEGLEQAMAAATLEAVAPLVDAGKLSAFLLQLSPVFRPPGHALDELAPLVAALAPHPVAIEFRHVAWTDEDRREETLGWLEDHDAVWVGVDAPEGKAPTLLPALDAVTRDDLAYLRAHGRNAKGWMHGRSVAERFGHHYADDELEEIAGRARALAADVPVVRLQFNNNRGSDAPEAAQRTRELLGQTREGAGAR
jgi:uncharacterized protein YecE (DUF72 family)